jgi:PAS domain-containing protein
MNLLGQFQAWARALADLSVALRHKGAIQDSFELEEQVQSYRETLRTAPPVDVSDARASAWKSLSRRSIDLLDRGCIETNAHGIIQRANQAASKLLNIPLPFMTGQPLLVFVAEEDRRAFLAEFMILRHRHPAQGAQWLVKCLPLFAHPFLASFAAERVADRDQKIVAIIWVITREPTA